MKFIFIFITCFTFGVLAIIGYYIWQQVEETIGDPAYQTKPKNILDRKALLNNPPADSIKGMITEMEGAVKWRSRAATESATISKPRLIQQGELLETGEDGTAEVSIDTVTVQLSAKSSVEFPQTLPGKFVFVQVSGSVTYINSESAPLSVRNRALLTLLTKGTMSISITEDEPIITIEVIGGNVELAYNDLDLVSQVIKLKKGETFVFNNELRDGTAY